MSIKHTCDICKEELSKSFYSEIMTREILIPSNLVPNQNVDLRPQLREGRFNLCQKCFTDKLTELTKIK